MLPCSFASASVGGGRAGLGRTAMILTSSAVKMNPPPTYTTLLILPHPPARLTILVTKCLSYNLCSAHLRVQFSCRFSCVIQLIKYVIINYLPQFLTHLDTLLPRPQRQNRTPTGPLGGRKENALFPHDDSTANIGIRSSSGNIRRRRPRQKGERSKK